MCGRYRLTAKERYIRDHFGLDEDPPWTPRWNIAPTQQIATIRQHRSEPKRIFGLMRWGLIPYWTRLANSVGEESESWILRLPVETSDHWSRARFQYLLKLVEFRSFQVIAVEAVACWI